MGLFQFQWLRAFVRRHTRPVPTDKAAVWKQRLSIVYAITAWNAFGFVMYMIFTGKADWAKFYGLKTPEDIQLTPAQQWSKTLGIKDATVIRVSGFQVSKYEIHNEFENAKDKTKNLQNTAQDTNKNEEQLSN